MTWHADKDSPVTPLNLPMALSGVAVEVGDGEGREESDGLPCIHGHGFTTAVFHRVRSAASVGLDAGAITTVLRKVLDMRE